MFASPFDIVTAIRFVFRRGCEILENGHLCGDSGYATAG
jgi:hypothetical protein